MPSATDRALTTLDVVASIVDHLDRRDMTRVARVNKAHFGAAANRLYRHLTTREVNLRMWSSLSNPRVDQYRHAVRVIDLREGRGQVTSVVIGPLRDTFPNAHTIFGKNAALGDAWQVGVTVDDDAKAVTLTRKTDYTIEDARAVLDRIPTLFEGPNAWAGYSKTVELGLYVAALRVPDASLVDFLDRCESCRSCNVVVNELTVRDIKMLTAAGRTRAARPKRPSLHIRELAVSNALTDERDLEPFFAGPIMPADTLLLAIALPLHDLPWLMQHVRVAAAAGRFDGVGLLALDHIHEEWDNFSDTSYSIDKTARVSNFTVTLTPLAEYKADGERQREKALDFYDRNLAYFACAWAALGDPDDGVVLKIGFSGHDVAFEKTWDWERDGEDPNDILPTMARAIRSLGFQRINEALEDDWKDYYCDPDVGPAWILGDLERLMGKE